MLSLFVLVLSIAGVASQGRFVPDFRYLEQPYRDYYQNMYNDYMKEIDGTYDSQQRYLAQQPGYDQQKQQYDGYKKQLMDSYASQGSRMDEFGNVVAGDPNAPTYLTCNGRGCIARG